MFDNLEKIIGGNAVDDHHFPFFVFIERDEDDKYFGGALINNFYILTSAQCIYPVNIYVLL